MRSIRSISRVLVPLAALAVSAGLSACISVTKTNTEVNASDGSARSDAQTQVQPAQAVSQSPGQSMTQTARQAQPAGAGGADLDVAQRMQQLLQTDLTRMPGDRDHETIFSPIPWPAPSELRLGSGVPGPAYWQNQADHLIAVDFDPVRRRVAAQQRITYTNNSPHDLDYIWLHLEQNLFRLDSRGALKSGRGQRFGNRDGFEGGVTIGAATVRMNTGESATVPIAIHDTLGRVDLPAALASRGGVATIDLEWSFTIPPYGSDRLGIETVEQGTVFQLAQWFPAPVRYDDRHGWNTLPYLGAGEFYTDFGTYEVSITAPREFIVGATGVLANPEEVLTAEQRQRLDQARGTHETVMIRTPEEVDDPASRPAGGGPLTWRFEADDVRTFAWTASDAFIWDAAAVRNSSANTLVHSLYPREGLPLWAESTDMLRFSIEHFNEKWWEYPYPTAINVNGIVGGMEYPMILFCRNRTSREGLFGVTDHEIAHNWFPMIVNTDERRHAWMDEGFATFMGIYSFQERFPGQTARRGNPRAFAERMLEPNQQPIVTYPDQVLGGRLGYLQYAKVSIGLFVLREHVLGPERFDFAFRRYIDKWAFKSPRPEDFFRCMEDAAGEDLAWFWRGWFYETGVLDQAVAMVEPETRRGSDASTGRQIVTLLNKGQIVMPVAMSIRLADGQVLERRLPVEIWHLSDRHDAPIETGGVPIVEVTLDPLGILPDVEPANDRWTAPDFEAARSN